MKKSYDITDFICLKGDLLTQNKLSVPSSDVFRYIHEKAVSGNEMAAVQLFEWMEYCSPQSMLEKKIYKNINIAFKELFNT